MILPPVVCRPVLMCLHRGVLQMTGEKGALMARLAKLKDAGTDELREKAQLQEALVRCVWPIADGC